MFKPTDNHAAPNESRYEATARALVITSTKRAKSMPPAFSISADSGSSTIAHRKKVVNPSVIPKPGITFGSRRPAFFMKSGSCRVLGAARADFGRPVHDEHRPARLRGEQRSIRAGRVRQIADAQHEHLGRSGRQVARELGDGLADGELRAHLEMAIGLGLGQ